MDELIKESFYKQVLKLFQNAKKSVSTAVNMTMVYSKDSIGETAFPQSE